MCVPRVEIDGDSFAIKSSMQKKTYGLSIYHYNVMVSIGSFSQQLMESISAKKHTVYLMVQISTS